MNIKFNPQSASSDRTPETVQNQEVQLENHLQQADDKTPRKPRFKISLVKGLAVVGVVGIITVIAIIGLITIVNIEDKNRDANYERGRRNAQKIVSVVAAADAAGYDFIGTTTVVADVIKKVTEGHTITGKENPSLEGAHFGVGALEDTDLLFASMFLEIKSGSIVYDPH